jgi:CBS domain containing-hemolysin-like protein
MVELIFLVVSVFLVAACGLFVAAEFALIAVNRPAVERLAAHGDKKAENVLRAIKTLSLQLSGAQVGITITNLAIGFLAEPAIAHFVHAPLVAIGLPTGVVPGVAVVIGIGLATAVTMVFGELVPKNLALAKPIGTAKLVVGPQRQFTRVMKYPIKLLNASANLLLKQAGVNPQEELASARSADELISLVRRSAEKGTLPHETAILLERSLNFGDYTALDVMTPRVRVRTVGADDTVADILALARKSGLSRFPVIGNDLDDVVGVVHVKHAIGVAHQDRKTTPVKQIMRPPVVVPSSIQLEPLLEALRKGGLQMAVVIDEFGGTDGIVTIEDLLEELVGEVKDEHDRSRQAIHKRAEDRWLLSGLLRPDEIGEELGIFLPEDEDFETIAGLVTDRLGHIPKAGEAVAIGAVSRGGDSLEVRLKVERMDGRRIDRVEMSLLGDELPAGADVEKRL